MSFVIHHAKLGGYIQKCDGMNIAHRDPDKATRYATSADARDARPGHHRDMGGSGFSGTVLSLETARADYRAEEARHQRWWR